MNEYILKICSTCKVEKELYDFNKSKSGKHGRQNRCKSCMKESNQLRYLESREEMLERNRIWHKENKEDIAKKKKKYREEKKEIIAIKKRQYRQKHKERETLKYHNDPAYKLKKILRSRLRGALQGNNKSSSTLELLGCTPQHLKEHLEAQFKEGMTWDNYSLYGWHVDHIKPCTSFDLTDPEQQRECFHYTNLQPLWAEDNLIKGAKVLT